MSHSFAAVLEAGPTGCVSVSSGRHWREFDTHDDILNGAIFSSFSEGKCNNDSHFLSSFSIQFFKGRIPELKLTYKQDFFFS